MDKLIYEFAGEKHNVETMAMAEVSLGCTTSLRKVTALHAEVEVNNCPYVIMNNDCPHDQHDPDSISCVIGSEDGMFQCPHFLEIKFFNGGNLVLCKGYFHDEDN